MLQDLQTTRARTADFVTQFGLLIHFILASSCSSLMPEESLLKKHCLSWLSSKVRKILPDSKNKSPYRIENRLISYIYNTIHYNIIQYNAMQCNAIQYHATQHDSMSSSSFGSTGRMSCTTVFHRPRSSIALLRSVGSMSVFLNNI